jgi:dipeptidyl aminopeptidase/acylaminoacyl peptidase
MEGIMKLIHRRIIVLLLFVLLVLPAVLPAQGNRADYERANKLREKFQGLAVNVVEQPTWVGTTTKFWYRKSVKGGNEFILVDAAAPEKKPAFDHARLAASLSAASGEKFTAVTLPFPSITFTDKESAIEFIAAGQRWSCSLADYACKKLGPAPAFGQRGARGGSPALDEEESPREFDNDVIDGMTDLSPQAQQQLGQRGAFPGAPGAAAPPTEKASPDAQWEAFIQNYNIFVRPKAKPADAFPLSWDGSEGNTYTLASIAWSPDSKKLAAYRVRPGYTRLVHYVESSPADQLQPKHSTREYAKPGDTLDIAQPVLFDLASKKQIDIANTLFPNPYSLSNPVWWKDGRGFTFEYNQRGHQVYRVIEVEAATGAARALISEEPQTFFSYRPLLGNRSETGTRYRLDISDGKEILWTSERDGWRHLYLYAGRAGQVKNQVTQGDWVFRAVDKVDEAKRQVWFQASGTRAGQDPYFTHSYRINFDGSGLTPLTEADGTHTVVYSADMAYFVDVWSRVDAPPTAELRRTEDRKLLLELEKGDASALVATGWKTPEPFKAKGRDGKTDIWGVIFRPTNFQPTRKYPVIESIYAGPQGSFVPKTFASFYAHQALAEIGFVVVQVDGMGTANRSKAFHDVAWKNLGDAGFPDRILWHKAVAAKYPWYDISRVGVYGTSAGGQNAGGAVLFHPEFYDAAAANCGCHDNRMDKMWWNEQWMGWPLGPHYAAASNVDNAYRLEGNLLMSVGEMDTNVDPASTFQVVNALLKANKTFDLLVVPGGGHGSGGDNYQRKMRDFFVRHLLGIAPPDWNTPQPPPAVRK